MNEGQIAVWSTVNNPDGQWEVMGQDTDGALTIVDNNGTFYFKSNSGDFSGTGPGGSGPHPG